MDRLRIIIADDHQIFREGLKNLIESNENYSVVGEANDGEKLLELVKHKKSDVIISDISMPNMDGLSAIKKISEQFPDIKILVLSMLKDNVHLKNALSHGAAGYILKDDAYDELQMAIERVRKGKRYISSALSQLFVERHVCADNDLDAPSLEILTKREREVLKYVAKGYPNKLIASRLKISSRTVEAHRGNLSKKLGIFNTAGLVKYALSKTLL